jgi:rhodanese-related sulfurtransferase
MFALRGRRLVVAPSLPAEPGMDEFLDGIEQFFGSDILAAVVAGLGALLLLKVIPRVIAGVPFVPPREVQQRLQDGEDALVIDVREPHEFNDALGHVPGALNLPMSQLSARAKALSGDLGAYADTPVYLACKSSNRAASAARTLKGAGLRKVHVVTGGMMKWNRQGLPTERG